MPNPPERASDGGRLLVVDDSRASLGLIASALRGYGYEVLTAQSGEEALAVLAREPVDCLVVDMMMPGLSGSETCARIRKDPSLRALPVIILTGRSDGDWTEEGIDAGADDYVVKSSDLRGLAARVRGQLRRRRAEQENARIREQLFDKELEANNMRTALEIASVRAALLADLERKNRELEEANRELEEARDRATRESRYKSNFLAMMSHELRTPLNSIVGFASILLDAGLPPDQRGHVETIAESGRDLTVMLERILEFAELAAGNTQLRREPYPIEFVIDALPMMLKPLADKRRVRVDYAVPEGLPVACIDIGRMKQVLFNLLTNAVQFSHEDSVVTLEARADEGHLVLDVRDRGIGIRAEDVPRILQGFDQLGASVLTKVQGIGLGLAFSKVLAELHGGSLSIDSEIGRGTTVTVRLPLG
ncbi:MAG: response regulator [Deltaproteobacteria bacterium]|nr:response regulator [Deltaproteobacteria bacterium]